MTHPPPLHLSACVFGRVKCGKTCLTGAPARLRRHPQDESHVSPLALCAVKVMGALHARRTSKLRATNVSGGCRGGGVVRS